MSKTLFLLDSGDPDEYKEIQKIAKENNSEIWGVTTNPSLIAKSASSRTTGRITQKEAFELQKQIVLEITGIVPGAVSAEVYADKNTKAPEMIDQGKEISTWHPRVVVKLPTTIEGFKARTGLRKEGIAVNNTLVFSQEQIFAVCLHEKLMQNLNPTINESNYCFISPFVGRLDDIGIDGMMLIEHGMKIKELFGNIPVWMLEASVRKAEHVKRGMDFGTELITAPAKVYDEWFTMSDEQKQSLDKSYADTLSPIEYWNPPDELFSISSIEEFTQAIESKSLNIHHELTDKGLIKFAQDWQAIIA
ncbi:MAG: transaldolase family protein [Candidatus Levybacteria bacterium]|nr:transaldolase family protein [Candidatus Levybacteria bacterium]